MSKNDTGEVRKFTGITIRHRLSWEAFVIFNASLAIIAAVFAASLWNDPVHQFWCGTNATLAVWCFVDFLKEAQNP